MRCRICGYDVKEEWEYCPRCGARSHNMLPNFNDIFSRMEKQMKDMDKDFERNFEIMDLSPLFKNMSKGGKGFSIKITRAGNEKPKVEVRKFGDASEPLTEKNSEKTGFKEKVKMFRPKISGRLEAKLKTTEEPKTEVRRIGDKILVDIHLPDVKSDEDIHVRSLENSIEVKAFSGGKAYFKILTKPDNATVERKPFKAGILRLEIY